MTDYTANSFATTRTNLAASLGCANDDYTVAATLLARIAAKEAADARPADPIAYTATVDQMRYLAKLITIRAGVAEQDKVIAQRAGELIASSAAYLAP